jgi:hypothetical protein
MAGLVSALIGLMVAVIIGVVVAIPVTKDAIDNASFTGTLATVTDIIPLLLAVLLIVGIAQVMG